jgi:MFS family permease
MSTEVSADITAGVWRTWRETSASVRLLLAGTFVNRLGGFLQVFVVLYLVDQGNTAAQAGVALGAYGAGSVVGMLAGGSLSDRFGARRTIVASMAGSAILLLGVLYTPSYLAKVALITAVGAFSQAYRPAVASALSAMVPPDRQVMIFAMHRLAINVGTTMLPLLGVALISVSYDLLFWGEALLALGYSTIAAVALPPGQLSHREDQHKGGYRILLTDRRYLLFLFGLFGLALIYVQCLAVLPLAVRERGMSTAVYATLIVINGALVIALELVVATRVQRWRARMAVVTGLLLTAVGMSLYAPVWGVAGFVAATVIWTLGEIVGAPTTYFVYPAGAGPASHRGRYLGAANGVYGLGTAIGPMIGVLLWTRVGDAVWWYCGLFGLVAALAAYTGVRVK